MTDTTHSIGPETQKAHVLPSMTPKDWAERLVQTSTKIDVEKPTLRAAREALWPLVVDSQQYAVPYTEARQEVMAFLRRAYPEETARERAAFGLSEAADPSTVGPSEALRESPRVVTASELLSMPAPLPEQLIGPYSVDELLFAYAFRGVGKTLFALGFASATAVQLSRTVRLLVPPDRLKDAQRILKIGKR